MVITEGVKHGLQGKVHKDMEDRLRGARGQSSWRQCEPTWGFPRCSRGVPEAYVAAQPLTLFSPVAVAAQAYSKIGRQMKLFRLGRFCCTHGPTPCPVR